MKLIINTSTLSGTGVTQVAVSFIYECIKYTDNQYYVILSKSVESSINKEEFPSNFKFYSIHNHPIYGYKGFKAKQQLKCIERNIKPDCVFSVFGPSCWRPKVPHLMGYAYPHYVYPESPIFKIMSFREKVIRCILRFFHKYYLLRDGKFYVCETDDVSNRLIDFLSVNSRQVFTVANTYNHYFDAWDTNDISVKRFLPIKKDEFRFLSLCSPYLHKNLQILNKVVPLIKNLKINVKFVVTISSDSYNKLFLDEVKPFIYNIGQIQPSQCPQIYSECDAVFSPTLLECFSATYPEAMKMKKPIITSNLPFARCICEDAALYFDPLDANSIYKCICDLVNNPSKYWELVRASSIRLRSFTTATQRAEMYLNICKKICKFK